VTERLHPAISRQKRITSALVSRSDPSLCSSLWQCLSGFISCQMYTCPAEAFMVFRRNRQACLSFLCFLFIINARHYFSSVFLGIGKVILLLLLSSLLMFLVVRSADIYRHLIAGLQALCLNLFEPVLDSGYVKRSRASLIVPRKPTLPFRFQLPPPVSFL
jgi:hypothetical protein